MASRTATQATWPRPLLGGILALAAAVGIGRFAYTPILPAMLATGELDTAQAGLLAAANYAGYLAGALLMVLAVRRSARPGALRAAALAVVATTALMAVTGGLAAWSIVRFLSGMASAGVFVLASGLVLDDMRRQGRAALSGWLYSGVGLGIVISGIAVRATAGAFGWRGDWLVLALLAAVALIPGWLWLSPTRRKPEAAGQVPPPAAGFARAAFALLFVAYFCEGLGYVVSGTFLVAIVEQMPGLARLGADVWIIVGLAVIPSTVLWTVTAGRVGYGAALVSAYMLQAAGIILPLLGGAGAAVASAILFGGTFAGITALTLSLAGQLTRQRSAALVGLLTAAFGVGQIIGPVRAGLIASRTRDFGPALLLAAGVVTGGGLLMIGLWRIDPFRAASSNTSLRENC